MKIPGGILAKSAVVLTTIAALSTTVLAAVDDYSYSYSTASDLDPVFGGLIASLGVGFYIIACCMGLIGLLFVVFNIWMIIDVLKRTEVELPNKTMWMVLLIVGLLMSFGWIPSLIYFFGPRKSMNAGK